MKLFPALLVILLIISCKDKASQPASDDTAQPATDTARVGGISTGDTTATYLPITDLIRQDILRVDSFAGGILRKITIRGKKDSAFSNPAAFRQAAKAFLMPELETAAFSKAFRETSIMDETTGQIQFIYFPRDHAAILDKVVVYVVPASSSGSSTDNVSRFYIEKKWMEGDTLIQQKLTWKTRQYFYIITIRQPKEQLSSTSIEKWIWDPEYFGE